MEFDRCVDNPSLAVITLEGHEREYLNTGMIDFLINAAVVGGHQLPRDSLSLEVCRKLLDHRHRKGNRIGRIPKPVLHVLTDIMSQATIDDLPPSEIAEYSNFVEHLQVASRFMSSEHSTTTLQTDYEILEQFRSSLPETLENTRE